MLGRCDITVTSDPVTPGDLSVQVVSGLGMSVTANPTHPSIVTTTVTAYNILYNHHQVTDWRFMVTYCGGSCSLVEQVVNQNISKVVPTVHE